jgi:serine/threonine-protein kinase
MGILKKHPATFLGLGITLLFLGLGVIRPHFLDSLELKFYDAAMQLRSAPQAPADIVMVNIDDNSIEKLGRWPWPRSHIAKGIEKISQGSPKVIGLNLALNEPEENAGLRELKELQELFAATILKQAGDKGAAFQKAILDAQSKLDNDARLAEAVKTAGVVVLPASFKGSKGSAVGGAAAKEVDPRLAGQAIQSVRSASGVDAPEAADITLPLPAFCRGSAGIGHTNPIVDRDGWSRREQLLYKYNGVYIPSFALRLAALCLNLTNDQIRVDPGSAVHLGSLIVPTNSRSELLLSFKGPGGAFKSYSFFDVVSDKIQPDAFKDKLVLVSASAAGIMSPINTPADPSMSPGEFSANVVWAMLNKNFIQKPQWGLAAELFMILALGLAITIVLPRLKAMRAGLASVLLFSLLIGGSTYLFASKGFWVRVTYPLLQLLLGCIGVVSLRYLVADTRTEKAKGQSAETNRMLGLSFQEKGMLDMAFDKFRRAPVDEDMKGILYNLALDFEKKKQFNKAIAVFDYIGKHDGAFKDVQERRKKMIQVGETVVLGAGSMGAPMSATDPDARPTLGRYEVVKQLGSGAMGVVYLGQDPRINRITAIKTFQFGSDFDPEEAGKMKRKFFVEAESAGTLSHPNIVTIYDAGEEQELAYIAMEYLEGEDLQNYTKENNLLPMRKVIDYIADIADALDYAHKKGIVHRDVKPANVMLLKTGTVKITDFGIARIAATSQTQTGVLKGTPYYMSPEQISGKKVDGRSDIFSLGVMLYQLLTAQLPFQGDSLATLMHQIMNVPQPDPRQYNPKIVKPLVGIIGRALEKDREKRYQRASELAAHLRMLGKRLDAAVVERRTKQAAG